MGSGAVLWDILSRSPTLESVVIDQNSRLIAVYRVVQTAVDALIAALSDLQGRYWAMAPEARSAMYYAVRDAFNQCDGTNVHQAAQFIFLNRTGFNGLYRVNRRGQFNVPMGRYQQPTICDPLALQQTHDALQRVTLLAGDYHQAARYAGPQTFVYLDPPYRPLSATASFTAYNAGAFTDDDQRQLAQFVQGLDKDGTQFLLSNADPHNTDPHDHFFDTLYHEFHRVRVPARRTINSQASGRGSIHELLIHNFPTR